MSPVLNTDVTVLNHAPQRCGKGRTKNILWDMKARYCKSCHEIL